MNIEAKAYTDIGNTKTVNQDAVLVKQAVSDIYGRIVFSVLCDGMGGLSCGEIASASMVKRMDTWFKLELPALLSMKNQTEKLSENAGRISGEKLFGQIEHQWNSIIREMNTKIKEYGQGQGISLGTTIICALFIQNHYLAMNVGDSRLYFMSDNEVKAISHDHSLIQKEIEEGKITPEEARQSDKKSILLQCIGASNVVEPEYYFGETQNNSSYLLCSDGLWRELEETDFIQLNGGDKVLEDLSDKVKAQGERDNISGIVIKVD